MGEFSSDYIILTNLKDCFNWLDRRNGFYWNPSNWIAHYLDNNNNPIDIHMQEDAHEFLINLFDRFDSILLNTDDKRLINDLFMTSMKLSMECSRCHQVSSHSEISNSLSLDIEDCNTLEESLKKYLSAEKVYDYYCDECRRNVQATRRVTFTQSPKNLIIQLKRFQYDPEAFNRYKINSEFMFPMILKLNEQSYPYSLRGVVVHAGSADGGHYVSYIQVKPAEWYLFDDATVKPVTVDDMKNHAFGSMHDVFFLCLCNVERISLFAVLLTNGFKRRQHAYELSCDSFVN